MAVETDKERGQDGTIPVGSRQSTAFEEAVALTGLGKFHYTLLIVCGFCLISMIFESLAAAYVAPAVQCDFDMSSFEKGFLGGIIYVGMIVSSHFWGFVADTRGRRLVLLITLGSDFICSLLAALMPTLPLLIFLRFLNGICICGPSAVTYAYLGEFHASSTRTHSMVYACIFLALAILVQPGLAWLVIPQPWEVPLGWITLRSWRVFLILGAVPSAATFFAMWLLLPESPKFLLSIGRDEEALDVLKKMYATNNGLPPEKFPVLALAADGQTTAVGVDTKSPQAIARHMWRQTAPLFKPPYVAYTLLSCVIQFGLYASSNGFLIWLPELLNRVGQYNGLYPGHETTVCDVIAIMAGQSPPPAAAELIQDNFSSNWTSAVPMTSSWTTEGQLQFAGANWTAVLQGVVGSEEILAVSSPPVSEKCVVTVNAVSFQNSLITGAGSALAYLSISVIIKYVSKKTIIAVSLAVSGVCGVGMVWAQTELQVLLLPLAFMVLSGMCVSVVNTVVVDTFPTYLRAMAVCLSICCGRLGTLVTTLMLGALIDSSCVLAMSILGGFVIVCGILSTLLPSESKMEKLRH